MTTSILTTLNTEDFKRLIVEAVKEATAKRSDPNVTNDLMEDYLDQKEAAKFLRVSFPTIIRWKHEGKVPYYQEGRKILYKKSELLQVLRKNESLLK